LFGATLEHTQLVWFIFKWQVVAYLNTSYTTSSSRERSFSNLAKTRNYTETFPFDF